MAQDPFDKGSTMHQTTIDEFHVTISFSKPRQFKTNIGSHKSFYVTLQETFKVS